MHQVDATIDSVLLLLPFSISVMMMVTYDGFAIGTSTEVGVGLESGNPQQDLFKTQYTTLLLKYSLHRSILTN